MIRWDIFDSMVVCTRGDETSQMQVYINGYGVGVGVNLIMATKDEQLL